MGIPHQCTVTAYGLLAGVAVVVYLCFGMVLTGLALSLVCLLLLLHEGLHDVLEEATVDKLTWLKGGPAMWALLSGMLYPPFEAI